MCVIRLAQSDLNKKESILRTSLCSVKLSSPGEGGERRSRFFSVKHRVWEMGSQGPVFCLVGAERDRVTGDPVLGQWHQKKAGHFHRSVVENGGWCGSSWQL